jgi:hypothetical protein
MQNPRNLGLGFKTPVSVSFPLGQFFLSSLDSVFSYQWLLKKGLAATVSRGLVGIFFLPFLFTVKLWVYFLGKGISTAVAVDYVGGDKIDLCSHRCLSPDPFCLSLHLNTAFSANASSTVSQSSVCCGTQCRDCVEEAGLPLRAWAATGEGLISFLEQTSTRQAGV